jgi:hypothetical protein
MNQEESKEWAEYVAEAGTYYDRQEYINKFGVGVIARQLWNDPIFTLGIEYGIKIAVAKIFGELTK